MESKKVVLITGCSSGFGYLTALKFARGGWFTFASVRDLESTGAKELWEIKKKENLPLELLPIDVTGSLSVEEGVNMAVNKFGRIDVLVNNAGFGYFGPVENFTIDEVKSQYETNVFGVLRMTKSVAPIMREQKLGTIINISSISGLITFPLYGVYASSKRALEALSEALRFELKPFGIKVTLVEPGSFRTGFDRGRRGPRPDEVHDTSYHKLLGQSGVGPVKTYKRFLPTFLREAGDPQKVADLIFRISQTPNPKARYLIGLDARFLNLLKKLLPEFLWEWLLHRVYQW
ncbi:MAG: SDR family oxidoreductase [Patescibacteria group bacterium]|nr:SDR family oxidoreductase [Patescibacteria group bacterium]